MKFLRVNNIIHIKYSADYTDIYTIDGKNGLVLKPLREWEERLPMNHFCRVQRSTIITVDHVEKIEKWFNQSYHVHLKCFNDPLTMGTKNLLKY